MQANITILQKPPGIGNQKMGFGYYDFGLFCFVYANEFRGELHWINCEKTIWQSECAAPIGVDYWFSSGTVAVIQLSPRAVGSTPSIVITGTEYNLATGKGFK